ncbi:hypothetical protein NRY68_06015 [Acidithiobacillus ferrooxidans]|uniref:hypothetical protein n=1 Tax=Acidithiobacillus ferrooxidans TaxID=920 RepID=UPI002148D1FA|nr:hypothetical protein [Acidithiobacillus ferrooxidans]MCR1345363.1 hypothetical protein [Acidithiobacillus ferrooxidans]MCR1354523.1 hypothetical protein [Acidithiobacillus ferrooxidans]
MLKNYTVCVARQISNTAEEIYAGHVIDKRQDLAAVFHCILDSRIVGTNECSPKLAITALREKLSRSDASRFSKVLELVYRPRPASASGVLSPKAVAEKICETLLKHRDAIVLPHDIEAVLLRSGDLDVVPDADVLVPNMALSGEDVFRIRTVPTTDWGF